MPLQATSGTASYDGFGGGVAAVPNYIEDVFSTYLYTGNGSTQTITNNIDLSTKGGMVWAKRRDSAINHGLWSTTSAGNFLISNATTANTALATGVTAFSTTGFSLGSGYFNTNAGTYTSWSFKQQAKFFTQVTYTGTGSTQTIAHDLGSTPAFIIVKRTDTTSNWACYHISLGATQNIALNSSAAAASSSYWDNTSPTSTVFTVGGSFSDVNASGGTYIAYLFAHDAGGFGLTGTDNVISCGSVIADAYVNLGYEPQWILTKDATDAGQEWVITDTMRGMNAIGSSTPIYLGLEPNSSRAEGNAGSYGAGAQINATGFQLNSSTVIPGSTYIYIAIRRGPMKVPTSGTSVFIPTYGDNDGVAPAIITNFPVDLGIVAKSTTSSILNRWASRLTGTNYLDSPSTAAEATGTAFKFDFQNGWVNSTINYTSAFSWNFRRAPSFFDEVCYTGDGTASRNITHNLGVTPQLIFAKSRSNVANWVAYNFAGNGLILNSAVAANSGFNFILSATSTTFTPADPASVGGSPNQSGQTYVAYLFATCAGVSKVGSYTGTATTKQVDCGFTGGARFVLIKRTDSAGDWYVWDSARGIVAGNDPYLFLNSTAAEVTTTDYIDTYSAGFEISSTAPAAINASGGTFIFLAIA